MFPVVKIARMMMYRRLSTICAFGLTLFTT